MADIFNFTDTWNAIGTTFNGIKLVVTNTASAAGSKLLDLSTTGATTSAFTVDKNGNVQINAVNVIVSQTALSNYYLGGAGNTTGSGGNNTAGGLTTLSANTSGEYNTGFGSNAMFTNTSGVRNTAFGYQALYASNGDRNVSVGFNSGINVTSGDQNTFVGYSTAAGITTGRANTVIGAGVGSLSSSLSNTIIIADGDGVQRIVVNSAGVMLLAALQASTTYANDAAAAIGGIPVGGLYRNGSVVQIRVT